MAAFKGGTRYHIKAWHRSVIGTHKYGGKIRRPNKEASYRGIIGRGNIRFVRGAFTYGDGSLGLLFRS